jgi:hypothetical protein
MSLSASRPVGTVITQSVVLHLPAGSCTSSLLILLDDPMLLLCAGGWRLGLTHSKFHVTDQLFILAHSWTGTQGSVVGTDMVGSGQLCLLSYLP